MIRKTQNIVGKGIGSLADPSACDRSPGCGCVQLAIPSAPLFRSTTPQTPEIRSFLCIDLLCFARSSSSFWFDQGAGAPENGAIQRRSRCDRSALLPWQGCIHTRNACCYSARDGCAGSLAHPFEKLVVFYERMCQGASTGSGSGKIDEKRQTRHSSKWYTTQQESEERLLNEQMEISLAADQPGQPGPPPYEEMVW